MNRVRLSTTVDPDLLRAAREAHGAGTDASVVEAALRALLAANRRAEVDEQYRCAYTREPIGRPDEWGDLATWRARAGR